jgi:hypothetical protein
LAEERRGYPSYGIHTGNGEGGGYSQKNDDGGMFTEGQKGYFTHGARKGNDDDNDWRVFKMAVTSQLAYGVYAYSASATGVGEVGRVDYDKTLALANRLAHYVSAQSADGNIASLTPDPKVFWFQNAEGAGRLLVSQTYYDEDYNPQPAKFSVYDAASLAQVWPASGTQPWGSLVNVYNIVTLTVNSVKYIYGVEYDAHLIFRVAIGANDSSYNYDSNTTYSYTGGSTYTFGQDIATDGASIYALFLNTSGSFGGTYANSTIVKLPPALGTPTATNSGLAGNAQSLKFWTDNGVTPSVSYFYVPAIGGEQHYPDPDATPPTPAAYNTGSKIQRIDTGLSTVDDLLINTQNGGSDTGDPGSPVGENTCDYYDIAFNADGTKVFVLKGVYTPTSSDFTWWLFYTNMNAVNAGTPPTAKLITDVSIAQDTDTYLNGYVWVLYFNTADNNVWFVRGNDIVIYDYSSVPPSAGLNAVTNVIGMGSAPASNLAPGGYSINGAAIYGVVGTVKGAGNPAGGAAQQAAQASAGEEEEER